MGGEILVLGAAVVGLVIFAFLAYRSFLPSARPYALPTLVLSALGGGYAAREAAPANIPWLFFSGFAFAAIIFGAQAHFIRWLRERHA